MLGRRNKNRVVGRVRRVCLLGAAITFAAFSAPAARAAEVSTLVENLPRYFSHSRPHWPRDRDVQDDEGSVLGTLQPWAVSFTGPGIHSFGSDSAFSREQDPTGDCPTWPYRHFFTGRDTLTFTFGVIAEGCQEVPGMLFRDSAGTQQRMELTPLFDWNVEAIWLTPRFLVFAVTRTDEGSLPQFVRIACWELETGRWFTSLTRESLMHRPGFDLSALLPDWYSARAYEVSGAVVLRGAQRGLALWPDQRAWSLVDAATGRPLRDRPRSAPRRIVTSPEFKIGPGVKNEIKSMLAKVHEKASRETVEFSVIELIQGPCARHRDDYAVVVRAIGRERAHVGVTEDLSSELYGICILDSSLTHVTRSFPPFPAYRLGDTTVYFDIDAPDDSIVVWKEGSTYSDVGGRLACPCPR